MPRWALSLAVLLLAGPSRRSPETIAPNDNRHTAGTFANGVLTVALEAREGEWRPEGDGGRALALAAFAEEGQALSTPGPFIRVPAGTIVRATLRNRLAKPLVVFGFGKSRGLSDSVTVPPNGVMPLSFAATTPGTYYYAARRGTDIFGGRAPDDGQLHGII